jgi:hypothetical protein
MPADESLKRLGGGRWETRDGRFAIEPQSGTWVVLDNTQTDDLGMPLVRGPFGSLTAAKAAIELARQIGPTESPLAERIKQAGKAGPRTKVSSPAGKSRRPDGGPAPDDGTTVATEPGPPAPPAEPRWLHDLGPADRRRARELIERLADLDVADPGAIVRAEIARDKPAVARLALERAIRMAIASSTGPGEAGRAVVAAILGGKDNGLGVRWRIVDDRGRRIDELDVAD